MPRFADEQYHRLSKKYDEYTLEIARIESLRDEVAEKIERLQDDYPIDYEYVRRLEEKGL